MSAVDQPWGAVDEAQADLYARLAALPVGLSVTNLDVLAALDTRELVARIRTAFQRVPASYARQIHRSLDLRRPDLLGGDEGLRVDVWSDLSAVWCDDLHILTIRRRPAP